MCAHDGEKSIGCDANTAFIAAANPSVILTLLDECERLRFALERISAIRDSIVGMQGFNFSEHAYPLVAALDAAGFKGAGHDIARENLGTLIEQRAALESDLSTVRASLAEALEIAHQATPPEHDDVHARIAALRKAGQP
jgi:hypothetical protein